MLTLPIKKKWFDMILSGEKKEEYREIKPYYDRLFHFKENTIQITRSIRFRNGYSLKSPIFQCHVKITKGYGKEEWGAEPNKQYYVLEIMCMEEI